MSIITKQIRYFSDNNEQNYPSNLKGEDLISGNAFSSITSIIKLGINTIPGTKFDINYNLISSNIIGVTGVYELDLTDLSASINSLTFDEKSINRIAENTNAYLIIDFLYEE